VKRYVAFTYRKYYPGGGKPDCIGAFDTPSEAMEITASDIYSWSDTAFLDILDTAEGSCSCPTRSSVRPARPGKEHEERTARREEDDFDDDVADYVPAAHTDPVEAMLDSAGLKRWAVEANHFELPEAASLVVEAGSWAGAASLATKALGTPARMDSIECLGPSEGTVPSIVAVSVRK
jgi:hypothetical protein